MNTREQFAELLIKTANDIKANNSTLNEEQMLKLMSEIMHQELSREAAAKHLNMSVSKFDNLVREGWLPKGRKRFGWKELRWYRDELDRAASRLNE